ncbi:MAG: UTP--glucose-1-phosphate uridylyltransferase [Chloroflexi bacterium]|nr:MAG: UTP--glucose-1-phosphate uridylyltransferase [Chloroflexota bacterium]
MTVRKAVILAAGFGTRFLPATKAVPKEMLPLLDRPVIQYIVEEALAAGLDQIIMVTSASKRAIEEHFDRSPELEDLLDKKGDAGRLDEVQRLWKMTEIAYVFQKERMGNGHAILMAQPFIGNEPFAVFFPDDVIFHDTPAIRQLIDQYERHAGTIVAVQEVPREEVVNYGVIEPEPMGERLYGVRRIIEKPSLEEAPSNLTTVGRFIVTPELLSVLQDTPPGRAGEIWLMDALDRLIAREPVYAYEYEGQRFDCGQPAGLLKASLFLAMRKPALRDELLSYLHAMQPER